MAQINITSNGINLGSLWARDKTLEVPNYASLIAGLARTKASIDATNYEREQNDAARQAFANAYDPETGAVNLAELAKGDPKTAAALYQDQQRRRMERQEPSYGTSPTKGINPETGDAGYFIVDKTGRQQWLGAGVPAPDVTASPSIVRVPSGDQEAAFVFDPRMKTMTPIPGARGPRFKADQPDYATAYDPNSPTGVSLQQKRSGLTMPPQTKTGIGLSVGPDGTVQLTSGDASAPAVLQKPTVNKIEEQIVNNAARLDRVRDIASSMDPKFLTYSYKAGNWLRSEKDKLGMADESDQAAIGEYTAFRSRAMGDLTQVLREMSGAAVTPQEAERQLKVIADAGSDSPAEFSTKLKETHRTVVKAMARLVRMRAMGMQPTFDREGQVVSFNGQSLDDRVIKLTGKAGDPELSQLRPGTLVESPDGRLGYTE